MELTAEEQAEFDRLLSLQEPGRVVRVPRLPTLAEITAHQACDRDDARLWRAAQLNRPANCTCKPFGLSILCVNGCYAEHMNRTTVPLDWYVSQLGDA